MNPRADTLKVWIEINRSAIRHNINEFRRLIGDKTQLWSVVKSNAYGHGLFSFIRIANELGVDGFCVDSVVEGVKLREQGITKPILVLGPTLPSLFMVSATHNLTLSISSYDTLTAYVNEIKSPERRPAIHLKIDTGMHRQGFYVADLPAVAKLLVKHKVKLTGVFSHFASAKDLNYPTYSERQFSSFETAVDILKRAGFTDIKRHISATGGTLVDSKYHLDAVRIGIGLYGVFPSKELELQLRDSVNLKPVLSWHSVISEIKEVEKGEYVSYDLTERLTRDTKMAIVPIGYWHGYPWSLSSAGQVLINGKRANVLGRVTMDMLMIDITGIKAKIGDRVTMIGTQEKETITAEELARRAKTTTAYEIITRLNPLTERIIT